MKLHYMGKYDLNPDSLPHKPHIPGAAPFKEAKSTKTLALICNIAAIVIAIPLIIILFLRCGQINWLPGCVISMLCLFPHEILHAVCFKDDVYLYTNLKQGMLFVVGTETMSKARFILMSLLPNIVFGFVPYIIAMIFPSLSILGSVGALSICMGAGDYYNVINALRQMPKGSRTYLHKFNSYWYIP